MKTWVRHDWKENKLRRKIGNRKSNLIEIEKRESRLSFSYMIYDEEVQVKDETSLKTFFVGSTGE